MEKRLDLRLVGKILGLPIYIDLESVKDIREPKSPFSERDKKFLMVQSMLMRSFEMSDKKLDEKLKEMGLADD